MNPACYVVDMDFSEGWEFLERLCGRPSLSVVGVVMLSRKPLTEDEITKALKLRVNAILSEPFSAMQIEGEIRRVLGCPRV